MQDINFLAVFIAAIAATIVGFIWYGALFGKPWRALMGISEAEAKKMKGPEMAVVTLKGFIASLVMSCVLANILLLFGSQDMMSALRLGAMLWLGLTATVQFMDMIYGHKKWKLFLINTGYQLASVLAIVAVLQGWS